MKIPFPLDPPRTNRFRLPHECAERCFPYKVKHFVWAVVGIPTVGFIALKIAESILQ